MNLKHVKQFLIQNLKLSKTLNGRVRAHHYITVTAELGLVHCYIGPTTEIKFFFSSMKIFTWTQRWYQGWRQTFGSLQVFCFPCWHPCGTGRSEAWIWGLFASLITRCPVLWYKKLGRFFNTLQTRLDGEDWLHTNKVNKKGADLCLASSIFALQSYMSTMLDL